MTQIFAATLAAKVARQWSRSRTGLPVLLYHHVGPSHKGIFPGGSVSPAIFEQQIGALVKHGYHSITPADYLAWRRGAKNPPPRPVMITFDDGYAETAEHAFPVLRQVGFKAVMFVVTGGIDGTSFWDVRNGWTRLRVMAREQIQFWTSQGFEFGAHTRTHPDLTKSARSELASEIRGSAEDLAEVVGSRIISFAYPHGRYNAAVLECTRSSFDLCFTTQWGLNERSADLHQLRRPEVLPEYSPADVRRLAHWGCTAGQVISAIRSSFRPPQNGSRAPAPLNSRSVQPSR